MNQPYSKSADLYDTIYQHFRDYRNVANYLRELIEQHRVRHTPNVSHNTLLDAGCATGLPTEQLATWYQVSGVDLNEQLLAIARKRLPTARLYHGDLASFWSGAQYDVIVWLDGTAHVDTQHLNRVIRNLSRHLRHEGVMLIHPWHEPAPGRYLGPMADGSYDKDRQIGVARTNYLVPLDASETRYSHVQTFVVSQPNGLGGFETRTFTETDHFTMHPLDDIEAAMRSAGIGHITRDHNGPLPRTTLVGMKTSAAQEPIGDIRTPEFQPTS